MGVKCVLDYLIIVYISLLFVKLFRVNFFLVCTVDKDNNDLLNYVWKFIFFLW